MLHKIIVLTSLFLAGCGEKKSDEKPNTVDTSNVINLEAIAKSENVYLDNDILVDQKLDGVVSVQTGKAFTQLNLKKGESNGNIPVVYLENIEGDVAQFIKQFSADLFVLGYSVAGLLDQASRNSPDPIQTYVDSVASLAWLTKDKHHSNPKWLELNQVLYIDNNADKLKADQNIKKDVSVEMCLKMLGYAYFQSGILTYLYGYIGYHGLESQTDLATFKKEQEYIGYVYEPDATGSVRFYSREDDNSAYNFKESYMYVVDLTAIPVANEKQGGMTSKQAKELNNKIKEMHGLGGYADKLIDKLKELGNTELSLEQIPGVFKDTDRYNYLRTKKSHSSPSAYQP